MGYDIVPEDVPLLGFDDWLLEVQVVWYLMDEGN